MTTLREAYDMVDRFLRNNLYDDDYANYAEALELLSSEPPQRKPIDDKTLWEMWVESPSDVLRFARAIERAHGIGEKK